VLQRALAVEASDRYPTAGALTGALELATTTAFVEQDARRRRLRRRLRTGAAAVGIDW
jgi:hypothetical protein